MIDGPVSTGGGRELIGFGGAADGITSGTSSSNSDHELWNVFARASASSTVSPSSAFDGGGRLDGGGDDGALWRWFDIEAGAETRGRRVRRHYHFWAPCVEALGIGLGGSITERAGRGT